MTAETLRVRFSFLADEMLGLVTDYDVAMAYEFFLGRPPENATAINSHKQRRFDDMIREFIRSGEFAAGTYQSLVMGQPISRRDNTRSASRQQISWVTKRMVVTEQERAQLYATESWDELFGKLLISDELTVDALPPKDEIALAINKNSKLDVNKDRAVVAIVENIERLLIELKTMLQTK